MPWSFDLPTKKAHRHLLGSPTPAGLTLVPDVISKETSALLIERAKRTRLTRVPAPPAWSRGGTRTMFDDEQLVEDVWAQLGHHISRPLDGWIPVGLNEHLEVIRHESGQRFAWHTDSPYVRNHDERSLLTVLVPLNEDYEGGEISFEPDPSILAKVGQALIFPHGLPYRSAAVRSGTRFVLRTDVVFRVPGKLLQLH